MRLKDKVAIVTGGASGIGRAIALGYAREGAKIAIVDINLEGAKATADVIRAEGGQAVAIQTDVAEKEQVDHVVSQTVDTFGTVDILVCSAGVMDAIPMLETTVEQWDRIIAVNDRGVMLCTQAAGRIMAEKKYGKILIINSLASVRGRGGQVAYVASKGALLAFVQSAGFQLAQYGITVNAISPGVIETEHKEVLLDREDQIRLLPMERPAVPEDMVGPALFFATDDSRYVTGETLKVDGASSVRLTGCEN